MKREMRGFLLGMGLVLLWVVLTAAIEHPGTRYDMEINPLNGYAYVINTETGDVYTVESRGWNHLGKPGDAAP